MRSSERRKVNVLEMESLRSLVRVSRMDKVRNEEVRRRAGIERELASRADQRVLRWFGHVERMDKYRVARKVLLAGDGGARVRGTPRLGWMDGTFTFLLSELLIPHASAPYNAVGTITHSYRHFFAFIPNPLLLRTLFSTSQTLYQSFILCTTSLSHPPSAATCDPRYLKQSTSSNGCEGGLGQ